MDKCNCNPKPPKKPFPAMSAHFAHTLEDMNEKYLQAQYIEIDAEQGTLDSEKLKTLISSRSNMLVYQDRIFRFGSKEDDIYKYINVYTEGDDKTYKSQEVILNGLTGVWKIIDLECDSSGDIGTLKEEVKNLEINVTNLSGKVDNIETSVEDLSASLALESLTREEEDQKLEDNIIQVINKLDNIGESLNMDGGEIVED